jgi:DNA primase
MHRRADTISGLCPIHRHHNQAHFHVNIIRNCWICYGDCHAGGSIIDFVSRKEGIGVREAALLIQKWFHIRRRANDIKREPISNCRRCVANPYRELI